MSEKRYVGGHGHNCPHCGSEDIEGESYEEDLDSPIDRVLLPCSCLSCESTWSDTYVLTGYTAFQVAESAGGPSK